MGDTDAGVEPGEWGRNYYELNDWSKGKDERGVVELWKGPQDGETVPEKVRTMAGGCGDCKRASRVRLEELLGTRDSMRSGNQRRATARRKRVGGRDGAATKGG